MEKRKLCWERFRIFTPDSMNVHILVTLRLGEREVLLIVDTGASCSVLDSQLAEQYLVEHDEPIDAMGLGGELESVARLKVTDLHFGGECLPACDMVASDLSSFSEIYETLLGEKVHGLLGCDILHRFRATISFSQKRISLRLPIETIG